MEPIRINPDEFKLENFINYYNHLMKGDSNADFEYSCSYL